MWNRGNINLSNKYKSEEVKLGDDSKDDVDFCEYSEEKKDDGKASSCDLEDPNLEPVALLSNIGMIKR